MSLKDKDRIVEFAMKSAKKTTSDELIELINLCDRLIKAKVIEKED